MRLKEKKIQFLYVSASVSKTRNRGESRKVGLIVAVSRFRGYSHRRTWPTQSRLLGPSVNCEDRKQVAVNLDGLGFSFIPALTLACAL